MIAGDGDSRRGSRAALVTLGILLSAIPPFLLFRDLRHDDAYITFRYAKNVAEGVGFVFNPGERALGATSPLHVLILAALELVARVPPPVAANFLGCLGVSLQAFFLYALLEKETRPSAAFVAAMVWLGLAEPYAWVALETNLFAALVLGAIWALESLPPAACGAFLGLAFLCRPEAALLVPIAAIVWWRRRRSSPLTMLAVAFAVVAPWLVFATWYFGSPVPRSFGAKRGALASWPYVRTVVSMSMRGPWRLVGVADRWPASRWISPALWALGAASVWRRHRRLAPFIAFAGALFAGYVAIAPPPEHAWHEYPIRLALDVLFLLGAAALLGVAARMSALRPLARPVLAGFAALALLAASLHTVAFSRTYRTDASLGGRDSAYHAVAAWTRRHVRQGRSLFALEVGTLGYETGLRMIDPFGLINATNDYPTTRHPASLCVLAMRYGPDLILAGNDDATVCFEKIGYVPVKWFEWRDPWSVLLVRSRDVLVDPSELEVLREELRKQLASAAGRG